MQARYALAHPQTLLSVLGCMSDSVSRISRPLETRIAILERRVVSISDVCGNTYHRLHYSMALRTCKSVILPFSFVVVDSLGKPLYGQWHGLLSLNQAEAKIQWYFQAQT